MPLRATIQKLWDPRQAGAVVGGVQGAGGPAGLNRLGVTGGPNRIFRMVRCIGRALGRCARPGLTVQVPVPVIRGFPCSAKVLFAMCVDVRRPVRDCARVRVVAGAPGCARGLPAVPCRSGPMTLPHGPAWLRSPVGLGKSVATLLGLCRHGRLRRAGGPHDADVTGSIADGDSAMHVRRQADPRTRSTPWPGHADDLLVAAIVVYLVWFRRVRVNAEVFHPFGHSKTRGWAILGLVRADREPVVPAPGHAGHLGRQRSRGLPRSRTGSSTPGGRCGSSRMIADRAGSTAYRQGRNIGRRSRTPPARCMLADVARHRGRRARDPRRPAADPDAGREGPGPGPRTGRRLTAAADCPFRWRTPVRLWCIRRRAEPRHRGDRDGLLGVLRRGQERAAARGAGRAGGGARADAAGQTADDGWQVWEYPNAATGMTSAA